MGAILGAGVAGLSSHAFASEASTHFSLLVPANNDNNGRDSILVVTAHAEGAAVTVTDTDEDGDDDDSAQAVLSKGQSLIVRIRDGAVNDDAGGKWDGDRIIVDSTLPVTVMLQTRSDWQHDWLPAEGGSMRGNEFFVHGSRDGWDFDAIAYEDDTTIEVYRITSASKIDSGTTNVELPGELVMRRTLQAGEDLMAVHKGAGNDLSAAGHSYRVLASKPSTVAYGALSRNARDGGGYVPSESGTTAGRHFYFPAVASRSHEKEIRIVTGETPASVSVRGWSSTAGWFSVSEAELAAYGHADLTGVSSREVRSASLFEVTSSAEVNVFYANWLETGRVGTSDVFTYVSALDGAGGSDVGQQFVAYLGPPGHEFRVAGVQGTFSHLFAAALEPNTTVRVRDVDTNGELFDRSILIAERDEIVDVRITQEEYAAMNDAPAGIRPYLRAESDKPISLAMNNWNDNWLAFAAGVVPGSLKVEVTPPVDPECGQDLEYAISVQNVGETSVSDIEFVVAAVGGTELRSEPERVALLEGGGVAEREASLRVPCSGSGTADLAGISVSATGDREDGLIAGAAQTSTQPIHIPEGVRIIELSAEPDQCAVELSWATQEDGAVTYIVYREAMDGSEPTEELGQVESLGVAASGFRYGFRDATATQLTDYRYYVRAEADGSVFSEAGPAVARPDRPFSEPPTATGDVFTDFRESGAILEDGLDSPVAGYDVDALGVAYDSLHDRLYLGVSAQGVFGDFDGDGDPNAGEGDRARFSEDEGFAIVLDLDEDGVGDAVAGVPFGGDLDLLTIGLFNREIGLRTPTLAFEPLPTELDGAVTASLLTEPGDGVSDLMIAVDNVSLLSDSLIDDIGVALYVVGPELFDSPERLPDVGFATVARQDNRAEGCGQATDQIHLGRFAAFGNIFTGTPAFDFVPFGWQDVPSGEVLAEPPQAEPGRVVSSPIVFMNEPEVSLGGLLDPDSFELPTTSAALSEFSVKRGTALVHVTELRHDFSGSSESQAAEVQEEGPGRERDRYENYDVQTFRMFTLDCSARVTVRQFGTSGPLLDDRRVRMRDDSVRVLEKMNPALVLAHSGIGTFFRGGDMARLHFGTPEDWTGLLGPGTAPEFTPYALLDDLSYHDSEVTPEDPYIYPIGEEGVELSAGLWFVNHYLWTYANSGTTRVETIFEPGADCGGSL